MIERLWLMVLIENRGNQGICGNKLFKSLAHPYNEFLNSILAQNKAWQNSFREINSFCSQHLIKKRFADMKL